MMHCATWQSESPTNILIVHVPPIWAICALAVKRGQPCWTGSRKAASDMSRETIWSVIRAKDKYIICFKIPTCESWMPSLDADSFTEVEPAEQKAKELAKRCHGRYSKYADQ